MVRDQTKSMRDDRHDEQAAETVALAIGARAGVIDQSVEPIGAEERFAAEEGQFERSAAIKRSDGAIDRSAGQVEAHIAGGCVAIVAIGAGQVAGVREHEDQVELLEHIALLERRHCTVGAGNTNKRAEAKRNQEVGMR